MVQDARGGASPGVDPAGGAGGDEGELPALLDAFSSSLPSSMMVRSAENRVSNTWSKAQHPEGGNQLAGDDGAFGQTELVPQRHADGGATWTMVCLGDRGWRLTSLVLSAPRWRPPGRSRRTGRTGRSRLVHGTSKAVVTLKLAGAAGIGQGGDALVLGAGLDAAAALDALGGIADDGGLSICDGLVAGHVLQLRVDQQVEAAAQVLQITVAVAGAGQAVLLVVGQDQLQDADLGVVDLLGLGPDLHALPHLGGAGGQQLSCRTPRRSTSRQWALMVWSG